MDVSIILCTYNRAEQLRRTLAGFCSLSVPSTVHWELVIVDNNSTDGTKAVCEEFGCSGASVKRRPDSRADSRRLTEPPLQLRYLFEPRQGKSVALNRALAETTADLLLFTDDDVDVDTQWIANYWAAANRHPTAAFFGGPVFPRWEAPPPRWMQDYSDSLLNGVTVHVDKGAVERSIRVEDGLFFGANLALRRAGLRNGFLFREDIGPTGPSPVRGEETELQKRLLADGATGFYVPAAIVHHRTAPERMTERYVRQWFKGQGMKRMRLDPAEAAGNHVWLGAPRHLWRKCLTAGAKYAATRWTCPARVWLPAEIQMARTWGMIQEIQSTNPQASNKSELENSK